MNTLAKAKQQIETAKPVPVFVCSTVFNGSAPRYTVLVDGEYYVVNDYLLRCLRRGETPSELELTPEDPDEQNDDMEADYSHREHFRTMLHRTR